MKEYRRICADIDLDALTHNLDEIHRCIRKETKIIAVVKADGYGHGAVPVSYTHLQWISHPAFLLIPVLLWEWRLQQI